MTKESVGSPSVILDTCFLIALLDPKNPFSKAAKTYHKYFLDHKISMIIPTIVVSEFNQLFTIAKLIETHNYRLLPFSYHDALRAGDAAYHLGLTNRSNNKNADDSGQYRAILKDDLKILGQVINREVDFLISSDDQIISRCTSLKQSGIISCSPISIREPFDSSVFSATGQGDLLDALEV